MAGAMLVGCQSDPPKFGDNTESRYSGRTLTTRLPESVRVPAAMAALDDVLRDRGYTIIETSVTEDKGRVVARAPRYNSYPRIVIEANQTATSCVVEMRNEPFGDREQVERLMGALLGKLGV